MAKVGRPSDYKSEYCERVIELGKQGASVVEMACDIGVSRPTLEENWTTAHPEFLEAFTRAKMFSQVWWEKKGREGMEKSSQEFQASIWSRSMAARFPHDWREVKGSEITGKDGGPIKQESKLNVEGLSEDQLRALASIKIDDDNR